MSMLVVVMRDLNVQDVDVLDMELGRRDPTALLAYWER